MDYLEIFDELLFFDRVITSQAHGQQMHRERMDQVIIFLGNSALDEAVRVCREEVGRFPSGKPKYRHTWREVGGAAGMNSSSAEQRWSRVQGEQAPLFPPTEA